MIVTKYYVKDGIKAKPILCEKHMFDMELDRAKNAGLRYVVQRYDSNVRVLVILY